MDTDVEGFSDQQVREIAATLTHRQVRILLEALEIIDMTSVADLVGLAYHRVKMLRRGAGGGPSLNALPSPLPIPGASPVYLRAEVVEWGRQTGRLALDGTPIRISSPGRSNADDAPRDDQGRFIKIV